MWGSALALEMEIDRAACEKLAEARRAHAAARVQRVQRVARRIARLQAELDATERRDTLVARGKPAASGC
jgi:hypothetical protein